MKQLKKILLLYILIGCSYGVYAQDSLLLSNAIETSLQNNFSIQIAENNRHIAEINNTWANTGGIPMLRFTGTDNIASVNFTEEPAENSLETKNTTNADYTQQALSAQIALQWTIFDGFAARIQKEKLAYLEELSHGNVQTLVETTLYSTILAYYEVLLQKHTLSAISYIHALSKDRYEYQKSLQELGVATTFDVLQAENAWLQDTSQYVLQRSAYETAIRNLKFIMADSSDATYLFPDEFEPSSIQFSKEELRSKIKNNQQIQNKYIQIASIEQDQKLAKSNLYPSLSLQTGASYNWNSTDYSIIDPIQGSNQRIFANLNLTYDIYTGGARKRAMQIADIQTHIAKLELQEMRFSLQNRIEQEYELYESRKILLSLAQQNVTAAQLNYELAKEHFELGSISSFDFRTIQIQYLHAVIQEIESRYLSIVSETTLFQLTGEIIQNNQ